MATILQDDFAGAAGTVLGRTPDVGTIVWAAAYDWGPSTIIHIDGNGNLYDSGAGGGDAVTAGGTFTEHDASVVVRSTLPASPINLWGFSITLSKHPDTASEAVSFTVIYSSSSYKYLLSSYGTSSGYVTFSPSTAVEHEFILTSSASGLTVTMDGSALGTLAPYAGHDTSMAGNDVSISLQKSGAIGFISAADILPGPPATVEAIVNATSPLGQPYVLALAALQYARASAASPLGNSAATAYHDFTGLLGDAITHYVMDLVTPSATLRVPISSWQATLQTGSSNYVQCVIPACMQWVEDINAATEFIIHRTVALPGGLAIEYEMARAPAVQINFDRGPQRYTCTISGYTDAFTANLDPPIIYDRNLLGIRSISSRASSAGLRVRCSVDWLLRPGHRAYADGTAFVVNYINYYAPQGSDSYMDVGS